MTSQLCYVLWFWNAYLVKAPVVDKYIKSTLAYGVGDCEDLDENDYFEIDSVDIHEHYDPKIFINDIAIISVDRPFDLEIVKPMKLAQTNSLLGDQSIWTFYL